MGTPHFTSKSLAAGAALLLVGAWAAVGGGEPDPCDPRFDGAGNLICSGDTSGAVDVELRLDDTMLRRDERLADAAKERVRRYADLVIDNGGSLTISAFGRSAARARVLVQREIPTLTELRLSKRADKETEVREEVEAELAAWATSQPESDAGSDILGALALTSGGTRTGGAPLVRVLITDGRVDVPGFRLVTALRTDPAGVDRALGDHLPEADASGRPDALAIFGIGGTGGLIVDEDPALTESLTTTLRRLCKGLATACHATATL